MQFLHMQRSELPKASQQPICTASQFVLPVCHLFRTLASDSPSQFHSAGIIHRMTVEVVAKHHLQPNRLLSPRTARLDMVLQKHVVDSNLDEYMLVLELSSVVELGGNRA